jgi:hypothetical protein
MDEIALKPLPMGPLSIVGLVLVGGFVALMIYQALRQGSAFQVPTRDFMAFFIIVAFISATAYMFVAKVSEGGDILIGALIAAFSAIVAMYFKTGKDE